MNTVCHDIYAVYLPEPTSQNNLIIHELATSSGLLSSGAIRATFQSFSVCACAEDKLHEQIDMGQN